MSVVFSDASSNDGMQTPCCLHVTPRYVFRFVKQRPHHDIRERGLFESGSFRTLCRDGCGITELGSVTPSDISLVEAVAVGPCTWSLERQGPSATAGLVLTLPFIALITSTLVHVAINSPCRSWRLVEVHPVGSVCFLSPAMTNGEARFTSLVFRAAITTHTRACNTISTARKRSISECLAGGNHTDSIGKFSWCCDLVLVIGALRFDCRALSVD